MLPEAVVDRRPRQALQLALDTGDIPAIDRQIGVLGISVITPGPPAGVRRLWRLVWDRWFAVDDMLLKPASKPILNGLTSVHHAELYIEEEAFDLEVVWSARYGDGVRQWRWIQKHCRHPVKLVGIGSMFEHSEDEQRFVAANSD